MRPNEFAGWPDGDVKTGGGGGGGRFWGGKEQPGEEVRAGSCGGGAAVERDGGCDGVTVPT